MRNRDPLDDLLSTGENDLADRLRKIHVRYGNDPAPPIGPELTQFTNAGPALHGVLRAVPIAETARLTSTTPEPHRLRALVRARSQRTMRVITAFIATVTGKIVLGSAVAAASLAGAQVGGVIDIVPGPADTTVISEDPADTEGDESGPDASPIEPSDDDAGVDDSDDGATENSNDGPVDDSDDGATDDSAVDGSDDGAVDDSDDGAVADSDDGAVDDVDDGNLDDANHGNLDDADDGDQEDADDGADDGTVEDADDGDQEGADDGAIDDAADGQVGETAD